MMYEIIIIGSGLAGITAAKNISNKDGQILMLDYNINKYAIVQKKHHTHTNSRVNQASFQFISKEYERLNKIKTSNFSLTGSLKLGGLSNVWGGAFFCSDHYIKKEKIKLNKKYFEDNFNLSTMNQVVEKTNINNSFEEKFVQNIDNKVAKFFRNNLLKQNSNKTIYNAADEILSLRQNKNFVIQDDVLVSQIKAHKTFVVVYAYKNNKKVQFKCKKLILACGTILTTKLILKENKYYEKKLKLLHNPHYAIIGLLKNKVENHNFENLDGELIYETMLDNKPVMGSLGMINRGAAEIIAAKIPFLPKAIVIKIIYLLRNRLFIGNCFLPNNLSDTTLHLKKNDVLEINGFVNKNVNNYVKKFKKNLKKITQNIAFFSFLKKMPNGSDIHYTGSLNQLSLKNNSEIKINKNIIIIDGSILNGNPIFPGGYIINNALEVSKRL